MKVLVLVGLGVLYLTLPISGVIVLLLAIVVLSYQQTIRAYPSGGGSYIVAGDNLGMLAGLTSRGGAARRLRADSLSLDRLGRCPDQSTGSRLLRYDIAMAVGAVVLIVLGNLRGIRESASIFAVPTYAFVGLMYVLIGYGLYRLFLGGGMTHEQPPSARQPIGEALGLFVLLRAFAQGCTAMTGTAVRHPDGGLLWPRRLAI